MCVELWLRKIWKRCMLFENTISGADLIVFKDYWLPCLNQSFMSLPLYIESVHPFLLCQLSHHHCHKYHKTIFALSHMTKIVVQRSKNSTPSHSILHYFWFSMPYAPWFYRAHNFQFKHMCSEKFKSCTPLATVNNFCVPNFVSDVPQYKSDINLCICNFLENMQNTCKQWFEGINIGI